MNGHMRNIFLFTPLSHPMLLRVSKWVATSRAGRHRKIRAMGGGAALAGAVLVAGRRCIGRRRRTQFEFFVQLSCLFGEDNPQLAAHDALEDTYTKVDNVVFAFKWRDGEVFTPERLRLLREATDMGWQMPFAIRVDLLTNYQHAWADGDDLIVRDLVDSDVRADNPDDLAEIRKIALAERATKKRLIAPNAETAAIVVTIQTPPGLKQRYRLLPQKPANYAIICRQKTLT